MDDNDADSTAGDVKTESMGIEIQQWRCEIGSFYSKCGGTKRYYNLNSQDDIFFTILTRRILLTVILFLSLLLLCGDVESNPGPGDKNNVDHESDKQVKTKRAYAVGSYNSHVRDEDPWVSLPKTSKWRLKRKKTRDLASIVQTHSMVVDNGRDVLDSQIETPTQEKSTTLCIHDTDELEDDLNDSEDFVSDSADTVWNSAYISKEWWSSVGEKDTDIWYDAVEDSLQEHPAEMLDDDCLTVDDDQLIYEGAPITAGQSALIILSMAFKHSITGELLADFLKCISLHCIQTNPIHSSLYKFRKYFSDLKGNLRIHRYCQKCDYLVSQGEGLCSVCKTLSDDLNTSYFVEIPVEDQIKELFKRKSFHDHILQRFNRKKRTIGNIEDIFDGELYKNHSKENGFLAGKKNISVMWYTDGIQLFNSSKTSLWPIYFAINELPYKERVLPENLLFAGLWYGRSKPSMATFLKPIHETMSRLKHQGVTVECGHCEETFISRVLILCGTCDLPAKCMVLNMTQFNGKYGCPRCLQPGEVVPTGKGHTRVFPVHVENIDGPKRYHDQFIAHGEEAFLTHTSVVGVKGPSWLTDICADAIQGTAIDYMHSVLLGIIRRLFTLWFDSKYSDQPFSVSKCLQLADHRLASIKPPHFITRLPRSIREHSQYWKASECRAWIFYYSTPVLFGILEPVYFHHYLLLYEAIYMLNLDSISMEDLQHTEEMLIRFCCQFSALYGINHMSANLHQLLHLTDVVKHLGPLWTYSCFAFESMNGRLLKMFHGTQSAVVQISTAVTSLMKLPKLSERMEKDIESPIGQFYKKLMNKQHRHGKITETISEGVHVIGGKCRQNLQQKYFEAILSHYRRPISDVFVYYRAMVFGCMYYSSHYKVLKRNSFTVKYKHNDILHFGQIVFFAKCCPVCTCICAEACSCENEHVAIIQQIQIVEENVMQEHGSSIVKARLGCIFSGRLTNQYIAIPVKNLMDLCIYVDVNKDHNKVFVTCRPNNKESD